MDQCLFCKISSKEIPSKTIFEDDQVIAILDIHPAIVGHTLLIPKKHTEHFKDLSKDLLEHLTAISHRLTGLMIANLKAEGVTSLIQSGSEAGQKSPHFIMHLIPRFDDDGLDFSIKTNLIEDKLAKKIAEKIKIKS